MSAAPPIRSADPAVSLLRLLFAREGETLRAAQCARALALPERELAALARRLREQGAEVEAVPELGLRAARSGRLNAPELLALRPPAGWPSAALCLDSPPSTQEAAAHWAARGFSHGLVVTAEHQSEGRGRQGRRWFSQHGKNLLVSLFLSQEQVSPLPALRIALAVRRALASRLGERLQLRWPNDVVVEGRKLAGLLIEALPGPAVPGVVVGIGINVNQSMAALPGELSRPSTSLLDLLGQETPRLELLLRLIEELERLCVTERPTVEALLTEYRHHCVTLGRRLAVATRGGRLEGRAEQVGPEGELILETGNGQRVSVYSGEVVETRQERDGIA